MKTSYSLVRTLLAPLTVLFGIHGASCDDSSPPAGGDASAPSTAAPQATATATAPAQKPPALDVTTLQTQLGCAGTKPTGPCEVLTGFAECQPWRPSPSGDSRWLGRGYRVRKGAIQEELLMLRMRSAPLSEVGPGQLPLKVSFLKLPDNVPGMEQQAEMALKKLARSDRPRTNNAAVRHLLDRNQWTEYFSVAAQGHQVFTILGSGAYLCQTADQRTLLVHRAEQRRQSGDGLYAVFSPVKW